MTEGNGDAAKKLTLSSLRMAYEKNAGVDSNREEMLSAVSDLLDSLTKGDLEGIEKCFQRLGISEEHELFTKIGMLTRTLHNSLSEIEQHLSKESGDITSTTLPDAASRLAAAIQYSSDSAMDVMNAIDHQMALLKESKLELGNVVKLCEEEQGISPEAKQRLFEYACTQREILQDLGSTTTDILIAQEYQDLNGQTLKKVAKLLGNLEIQLLSLVRAFGVKLDNLPESQEKQASTQDMADKLLDRFGF